MDDMGDDWVLKEKKAKSKRKAMGDLELIANKVTLFDQRKKGETKENYESPSLINILADRNEYNQIEDGGGCGIASPTIMNILSWNCRRLGNPQTV